MAQLPQQAGPDPLVGHAVLDQQHVERPRRGVRLGGPRRLGGGARVAAEARREVERGALPRLALQPDLAFQGFDQPGRDRQPQPRAAVAARRRGVGLHELFEDHPLLVRRDADAGVGDLEPQGDRLAARLLHAHPQGDLAPLGELDRVRQQVGQHLPQQAGVAEQRVRRVVGDVAAHGDRPAVQPGRERLHQVAEALAQPERSALALQLVRLHLREVEDVVDDVQQRLRRFADGPQVVVLDRRQAGVVEQLRRADDRVERRADLVADVRQEGALGPVGAFGRVPRLPQLRRLVPQVLLGALERGDVGVAAEEADRLAPLVADREPAAAHPDRAAVPVAVAHDLVVRVAGIREVPGEVVEGEVAVLGEDVGHPPLGGVGDLVVAVAEELLEARAHPLLVLPLDVPVPDAVERAGLEELEDRRVAADQLVELLLQIVLVLAHAWAPAADLRPILTARAGERGRIPAIAAATPAPGA